LFILSISFIPFNFVKYFMECVLINFKTMSFDLCMYEKLHVELLLKNSLHSIFHFLSKKNIDGSISCAKFLFIFLVFYARTKFGGKNSHSNSKSRTPTNLKSNNAFDMQSTQRSQHVRSIFIAQFGLVSGENVLKK
jgi:hypothetical protein